LEEARKPAIMEVKSMKVGMLAYTDMAEIVYKGNPNYKFAAGEDKRGCTKTLKFDDSIKKDIEELRSKVDILIVSLHWEWRKALKFCLNRGNLPTVL